MCVCVCVYGLYVCGVCLYFCGFCMCVYLFCVYVSVLVMFVWICACEYNYERGVFVIFHMFVLCAGVCFVF